MAEFVNEHHKEYASKGVAGAGLGLGIAGTALGILGGAAGLGGLARNGGMGMCNHEWFGGCAPVSQNELNLMAQLASKDGELARAQASAHTNTVGSEVYDKAISYSNRQDDRQNAVIKELTAYVIENAKKAAVLETEVKCLNQKLDYEIKSVRSDMACMYQTLDKKFECYVPWAKKIDSALLCPQPTFPTPA